MRGATASASTFAVSMVSVPPSGMASRALTARFIRTCSSWPGSAWTRRGRAERASQLDVLADEPPQQLLHVAHQRVEVERPGLQRSACGRRPAAAGSAPRPGRRVVDLLDVAVVAGRPARGASGSGRM